jgi:hypothetical protein
MPSTHVLPFDPAAVALTDDVTDATLNEAKALPLSRQLLAKLVRDILGLRDGALLPTLD